jgi:hypothetical protein
MHERVLIVSGLALFLALFTYPVWWAAASGTRASGPQIQLPRNASACVASEATMRATHMQMLSRWRTGVVRQGIHQVRLADGRTFETSLSRTCLGQCHSKSEFCDRCHSYSGVATPSCWQCHTDPQRAAGRMQ